MAQLPSVTLPAGEWVDLYLATGIANGTRIIAQNLGNRKVILVDSATQPAPDSGFNSLLPNEYVISALTPDGVWAKSSGGSKLQVEEYIA